MSSSAASSYVYPTAPLTTVFTPPPGCTSTYVVYTKHAVRYAYNHDNLNRECLVPGTQDDEIYRSTRWSPGVCPSGWVAHSRTTVNDVYTSFCCPGELGLQQYSMSGYGSGLCLPTTISWTDIPLQSPITGIWPIEVQWASSDLDIFTPKSAPITPYYSFTATTTASETPSSVPQSSGSPSTTPSQTARSQQQTGTSQGAHTGVNGKNSSDLSTGAKAGIGVGVAIAFIAIAAALVLLFRYRRKKKAAPTGNGQSDVRKYELPAQQQPHQLGGNPIHEAAGHYKGSEVDASRRAELEGG